VLIRSLLTFLLAFCVLPAVAQAPDSDSQAADLLRQVLNVSGATLNPFSGFIAQGKITYYWAGHLVQGTATIRGRGSDQSRMDANLPDGIRSVSTSKQGGARKTPDGKLTVIPEHNTVNSGILTLPYPSIAALLADSNVSVRYIGQNKEAGRLVHQVRVTRNFAEAADPDGLLAALFRRDYFIDAQSLLVLRIEDTTHPAQS
jgi:hypothetical protein